MFDLLLANALGFAFAFRKELSGNTDITPPSFTFTLEKQPVNENQAPVVQPPAEKNTPPVRISKQQQNLFEKYLKASERGETAEALSFVSRLLKLNPQNPLYHLAIAQHLARINELDSALEHYDKALDLNDDFPLIPDDLQKTIQDSISEIERLQSALRKTKEKLNAKGIQQSDKEILADIIKQRAEKIEKI